MFELNDVQKNYVIIGLLIVVLVLIGATFYFYQGYDSSESGLTVDQAKEKAAQFINNNLTAEGETVTVESATPTSGLYKLGLNVKGQSYDSYITKDGSLFFVQAYNIEEMGKSKEVPKRTTPDLKLFTMAYCPFGLQTIKAYLPVYDLLKDKADMGIYFVNYAMHDKKELDENMRQYCIQKNQTDKFDDYLSCFVNSSSSEMCLDQAGVDQSSLESCVSGVDEEYGITEKYNDKSSWLNGVYPKFPIHSDLNEKYEVEGSPTLVINDKKVNLDTRSPENLKNLLCQGFEEKPEECSQTLSTSTPSPGFGGGTSDNSSGNCE